MEWKVWYNIPNTLQILTYPVKCAPCELADLHNHWWLNRYKLGKNNKLWYWTLIWNEFSLCIVACSHCVLLIVAFYEIYSAQLGGANVILRGGREKAKCLNLQKRSRIFTGIYEYIYVWNAQVHKQIFLWNSTGWEHTPRDVQCVMDWMVMQQQNHANRHTGPSDKLSSRVINNVAFLLLDGLYSSYTAVLNFSGCRFVPPYTYISEIFAK